MRRLFFAISSIVLLLFLGFGIYVWNRTPAWVEQAAAAQTRRTGLLIGLEDIHPFFWGLSVRSARIGPKFPPVKLEPQNISLSVSPLSVFRLAPQFLLTADLLGGKARLDAVLRNPGGVRGKGQADLKNLNIAAQPQIRALGLESGLLSASLSDAIFDERGILSGKLELSLVDANKPGETKLPIPTPEGLITATVPEITDLSLSAAGDVDLGGLAMRRIMLRSSLIAARGDAFLTRGDSPDRTTIRANFEIQLSDAGQKELGIYFIMLGGGGAEIASAKRLSLSISGPIKKPVVRVRALDAPNP